jgi:hypothetical protein
MRRVWAIGAPDADSIERARSWRYRPSVDDDPFPARPLSSRPTRRAPDPPQFWDRSGRLLPRAEPEPTPAPPPPPARPAAGDPPRPVWKVQSHHLTRFEDAQPPRRPNTAAVPSEPQRAADNRRSQVRHPLSTAGNAAAAAKRAKQVDPQSLWRRQEEAARRPRCLAAPPVIPWRISSRSGSIAARAIHKRTASANGRPADSGPAPRPPRRLAASRPPSAHLLRSSLSRIDRGPVPELPEVARPPQPQPKPRARPLRRSASATGAGNRESGYRRPSVRDEIEKKLIAFTNKFGNSSGDLRATNRERSGKIPQFFEMLLSTLASPAHKERVEGLKPKISDRKRQ